MMIKICTSKANDFQPLVYRGVRPIDAAEQLRNLLRQNSGFLAQHGMPAAESFFAEPEIDTRQGIIDWYTSGTSTPIPLAGLSEQDRLSAYALLRTYADALLALSATNKDPTGLQLLRLALQHPSQEDLFLVDGHPVLTNWGFRSGVAEAIPENILRYGSHSSTPQPLQSPRPQPQQQAAAAPQPVIPPVPPVTPPTPPVHNYYLLTAAPGCISWLLPLFLALLLLWLLLAGLGIVPSPLPSSCMRREAPDTSTETIRSAQLSDELALVLTQLTERAKLCTPAKKEPPHTEKEPVLPQEEPKEEKEQTPFFGNTPPEEPQHKPEPKPRPKPKAEKPQPAPKPEIKPAPQAVPPAPKEEPKPAAEPKRKPQPNQPLTIPNDAAQKNDLSFLEGCWRSQTDIPTNAGDRTVSEYCFNKRGTGRRFEHTRNGSRCSGSVTAHFEGSTLLMESGQAHCPGGNSFIPEQIICRGSENSTQCRGRQNDRGHIVQWDAPFRRK